MTEEASQPKGEVITTEFVAVRKRAASKPADLPSQVRAMRAIARDNYVVARISLDCGYPISGCLLAHQAVEMYLKGIISANGGKASGHNLRELVGHGATRFNISGLVSMAQNKDQMTLLKQLCDVYESLRFGEEAGYLIENENIVLFLDEIALEFEKMYYVKLGESGRIRIHVHETMKNRFLKLNDYFTSEMVSNNSRVNESSDDQKLAELPPEDAIRLFTVTTMMAKDVAGSISFTHVPKRISKEDQAKTTPTEADGATTP